MDDNMTKRMMVGGRGRKNDDRRVGSRMKTAGAALVFTFGIS